MPDSALLVRKIDRAFEFLDTDGDGLIETDDVVALGGRLLTAFGETQTTPKGQAVVGSFGLFWTTLLAEMDADSDGQISPEEYRDGLSAAFVEGPHFERVFRPAAEAVARLCDTDGDGVVGLDEFRKMHEAFGSSPQDTDAAFRKLDRSGDGTLTVQELVEAARQFYLSDDPNAVGNWLFGDLDG